MVQAASHQGLGSLNQSFPPWDYDAIMYWNSRMGANAQGRGGLPPLTYAYAGTDKYTYWHPGQGCFVEVDPTVAPQVPRDGHFADTRMSRFLISAPTLFRDMTFQSGLTGIIDSSAATIATWILKPTPALTDTAAAGNTSGVTKRMWNTAVNEPAGADDRRKIWSILVRRNDGLAISGTTLTMGVSLNASGALGADISVGGTRYQRIRSDGWYLCWTTVQEEANQDLFYWVQIADGVEFLRYESPQVEGDTGQIIVGAASQVDILEPSSRVLTISGDGTGRTRTSHNITLDEAYQIPPNGWMGCTIIPRSNYADHVADGSGVGEFNILTWEIDGSNRIRMRTSIADDAFVFEINTSGEGASQVFAELVPGDHVEGQAMGLVATWGFRDGLFRALLCLNGVAVELDTASPDGMPTGAGSISIGRGVSGATPANMNVQNVAIGARSLSEHDVRVLSRWFQKDNLPIMGPDAA